MSLTSWFLVSSGGTRHRLPREMIFVGRDDCELMLQSRSVDKQHAVVNYDPDTDEHRVKDLGSLNGTFVNDVRIQEQVYTTLKMEDKLRFGYDTNLFTVVRGELHVPEEALKHEKFTSQLQLAKKPVDTAESSRAAEPKGAEGSGESPAKPSEAPKGDDKAAADIAVLHRGTPLYGQPSWWGDGDADDENSVKQDNKPSDPKQARCEPDAKDGPAAGGVPGPNQGPGPEPSYFEIPSKEASTSGGGGGGNGDVPPKGHQGSGAAKVAAADPALSQEAAAHGHASFTIDFDTLAPGKVVVKERAAASKGGQEQQHRPRPKRGAGEELSALQAAMVAAEVKVADWLAQNELPLARSESAADDGDGDSVKSDVPVQLKSLRGSRHEDGTQSDSENLLGDQFSARRAMFQERAGARGLRTGIARADGAFPARDDPYHPDNRKHRPPVAPKKLAPVGGESRDATANTTAAPAAAATSSSAHRAPRSGPSSAGTRETQPDPREGPQRGRHSDDLSDRGTYTIDFENGSQEVEEARRMIDKVFGVEDNQALTKLRYPEHQRDRVSICPRPGAVESRRAAAHMASEVLPEDLVVVGGPRWVSQWASLAASHVRTDPEGSGAESHVYVNNEKVSADVSEVSHSSASAPSSSQTERKRRTLPQPPLDETTLQDGSRSRPARWPPATSEKQDTETQEKESKFQGPSRASHRAVGGPPAATVRDPAGGTARGGRQAAGGAGSEAGGRRSGQSQGGSPCKSTGSGAERRSADGRKRKEEEKEREKLGKPLLRQESFTVERPSGNVPLELIPCIDSLTTAATSTSTSTAASTQTRDPGGGPVSDGIDAATLLRDNEAVAAFLETTLSDLADPPSYSLEEGSMSPESDIDTTSTVSQAGGEGGGGGGGGRKVAQKRRPGAGPPRVASNAAAANRGGAADKTRSSQQSASGAGGPRSRAWTSLELTDDDLNSSLLSDTQPAPPAPHVPSRGRGHAQAVSKAEPGPGGRAGRGKTAASGSAASVASSPASKPAVAPRPRPTRASLLRRARLGESPEADLGDADRLSVASEASTASSASRPSAGRRTLSRIEALAQPRRPRVSSPSARSDSEATSSRSRGLPLRPPPESAARAGFRSGGYPSAAASAPRARANSASKLPDKSAVTSYNHNATAANNRWRRMPIEYASTSEDEFGSNRHSTKNARARPLAPRVTQLGGSAPTTPSPVGMRRHSREQDDYMRDWTAHSEEIARISQDLAKDLAMLAREIHDVAGEIDSVSPSSAADPSALDDRVFAESLGSAPEISTTSVELRPPAANGQDLRALRRRTWNRDEAVMDSLLLASVSQLSAKIRQAVEKTTGKIRILFKDKDRNWEEIQSKMQLELEMPLLKTSNQEISSILQDLKRIEKQLVVIDIMVDPDGTLDALSSLGLTSPLVSERRVSPGSQAQSGGPLLGEGAAGAPLAPAAPTEVAERDAGLDVNSNAAAGSGGQKSSVSHP
ncbi:centrosomal protein of 170 kDa [Sardina pilchardus]|uniref:centrosomal protein of 170 kDa n=1 Tax=Sardina pilchardus TaxID=27697 RepID=UPI002E12F4FA